MSDFRIKKINLGSVETNCYIVYNAVGKKAIIIDPADNADKIKSVCQELGVTPEAVILTHGHYDHIMAADEIRKEYSIFIYASEKEAELLANPEYNLSAMLGRSLSLKIDKPLKNGDILELIGFNVKVIETSGHTAGSICLYFESENVLISGDTLFRGSFGRVDLPTANAMEIIYSITKVLFKLEDEVIVYPGHGLETTIGYEKEYNPILQYLK
jgi:Zn-dependent hydrolases, including glyoxylases